MSSIILPNSNITTSSLGFGCAYLTGGFEFKKNRRLVDAAFDAGFRHFDVAPLYGIGTAESVLAAALAKRRAQVTIASKVGRPRPILTTKMQLIRLLATPLRHYAAWFLRWRDKKIVEGKVSRGNFDLPFVEQSISETLQNLQTDYLDILLLHEATLEDLTDELLTFLDKKRSAGVFRAVGVASTYDKIESIVPVYGAFFDVIQYSWSVLDIDQLNFSQNHFVITHRAIMRAYEPLRFWMMSDQTVADRLSNAVGYDLSTPLTLSNILLGAAISYNSLGVSLVGTRRLERIYENAAVLNDTKLVQAGAKLLKAVANEKGRPKPD